MQSNSPLEAAQQELSRRQAARIKELEDINEVLHGDLFSEQVALKKMTKRNQALEASAIEWDHKLRAAQADLQAAHEALDLAEWRASSESKEEREREEAAQRREMRVARTWELDREGLEAKLAALRRRVNA